MLKLQLCTLIYYLLVNSSFCHREFRTRFGSILGKTADKHSFAVLGAGVLAAGTHTQGGGVSRVHKQQEM